MVLKQWTNAVIGVIDKKLERFDPKWQAANGKGGLRSRYEDKTGIARHREWRGVKDTFVDYTAWLNNLLAMGKMVASAPVPILKGFWEYRWMGSYLGTFAFIDRLFEGYREDELKIAHMNMHCIVSSLTKKIALVLANDKRLGGGRDSDNIVPMDEVMPPLFMTGFPGLIPIPIQTLPEFIICDIDQHLEPYYIDVAESFGLAADVCSRCSAETGVAIDDDFPIVGRAVLTTNMPCNASEATSMFQRRRIALPDFPVTLAMIHNEPGAHPYSKQVLKDAIAFIEKEYGVQYDWDALFDRAAHMNEQNTIELEKWDIFKTPYSALCGIAETLYRLYSWASVNGQEDQFTKNDRKKFGSLPGITDREYYTNSFHIPVYFPISAAKKIRLEAPYHALTNAGHISYIEMDGDPTKNLDAFEAVVRAMHDAGIGYGSINHPVDRDPVCGYNGIIGDSCPKCGRQEEEVHFERIRRITGYLVGTLDRFNNAKRAEEADRVKHGTSEE